MNKIVALKVQIICWCGDKYRLTILRGIVLNTEGVSNKNNIVYFYLKGTISYKLVMREEKSNEI